MSAELDAIKALRESVNAKQGEIMKTAEDALKAAQDNGTLSANAKANADKALAELNEARQKLNALETRLGEAEAVFAALPTAAQNTRARGLGEMVTADEGMRTFLAEAVMGSGKLSHRVGIKAAIKGGRDNGLPSVQHIGIAPVVQQRLTVRDLLMPGRTESNSVEFIRETGYTNNAAAVAEAAQKPESQLTFEAVSAPVATIAHWVHATRQVLADVPMLESHINERLIYGLKLKEEAQLLKGSGVSLNVQGLYTAATAYQNSGVTVTKETLVDKLRLAMLQVELTGDSSQGIVLHPADWAAIELSKADNGEYLLANPFNQTIPRLWGLPVVASQSLAQGEFLVGAFGTAAQLWDREDASIMISLEDRDNFTKNMVTILCEERLALTIYRPESFVKNGAVGDSSGDGDVESTG